jgi:hypothetical protein
MLAMTSSRRSSKVLLITDNRTGSEPPAAAPIRRFRIARLTLTPPPDAGRFDHLRRVYD